MTSALRNRKKTVWPVGKEGREIKEKKAKADHKGLDKVKGIQALAWPLLSCFPFITLRIVVPREWPGTCYVAQTGLKLMGLLVQPPEMFGMCHHTRHGILVLLQVCLGALRDEWRGLTWSLSLFHHFISPPGRQCPGFGMGNQGCSRDPTLD